PVLGDDGDDAARHVADVGPDAAGRDLDLGEGVAPDVEPEAGPGERVLGTDAVHDVAGFVGAPAADVEPRRVLHDARLRGDDVLHVAHGRRFDLVLRDGERTGGLLDIHEWPLPDNDDFALRREDGLTEFDVEFGRLAVSDADGGE